MDLASASTSYGSSGQIYPERSDRSGPAAERDAGHAGPPDQVEGADQIAVASIAVGEDHEPDPRSPFTSSPIRWRKAGGSSRLPFKESSPCRVISTRTSDCTKPAVAPSRQGARRGELPFRDARRGARWWRRCGQAREAAPPEQPLLGRQRRMDLGHRPQDLTIGPEHERPSLAADGVDLARIVGR